MHIRVAALCPECEDVFVAGIGHCPSCANTEYLLIDSLLNNKSTIEADTLLKLALAVSRNRLINTTNEEYGKVFQSIEKYLEEKGLKIKI